MKTATHTNFVRIDDISLPMMRGCLVDAEGAELAGGGLFIEFPADIIPSERRRYSEIVRIRWTSIAPEEGDSVADLRSAARSSFEFLHD